MKLKNTIKENYKMIKEEPLQKTIAFIFVATIINTIIVCISLK